MTDVSATLDDWVSRCKAHKLMVTPSRRAILAAMLQRAATCDAVTWLLAARVHHPATSLNTVYRFLRDMEQRGLVDVEAVPHERCRWRLRLAVPASEADELLRPLQTLLCDMEALGLAEPRSSAEAFSPAPDTSVSASNWQLLQRIAERLGYRLVSHPA